MEKEKKDEKEKKLNKKIVIKRCIRKIEKR